MKGFPVTIDRSLGGSGAVWTVERRENCPFWKSNHTVSVVQPGGQEPSRLRSSGSRAASDQHYGFVELKLILYLIKHQAMQTCFQVRRPRCVEYKLKYNIKYIQYSQTQLCILLDCIVLDYNSTSRKLKALSIVHSTCLKIILKMALQIGLNMSLEL